MTTSFPVTKTGLRFGLATALVGCLALALIAGPGRAADDPVLAKVNGAVNAAIAEPEVVKQLIDLQFIPIGKGSPDELERFVASETTRWAKVLQQAGVAGSE